MHHMLTHLLLFHLLVAVALAGDGRRRVLHLPGDLLLGGLFPMHEQVILVWSRAGCEAAG